MFGGIREEWRTFRADPPGERFARHERRGEQRSAAQRAMRIVLGAVLLALGVFLLFVPGPGLLVMVFGLAMFAGESRWIARRLDAAEVWLRARIARFKR